MPIYEVFCKKCNKHSDIFLPLSRFNELPMCCGEVVSRKISAPMVINDIMPYISMFDGSFIKSRSHHREHLTSNNLVEVGNENPIKKKSFSEEKNKKESLRREISARLDAIGT